MACFFIPALENQEPHEGLSERSKRVFVQGIARAAGLEAVQSAHNVPFGRADLQDVFSNIQRLVDAGIASGWGRAQAFPDEPRVSSWWIKIRKETAGGLSINDDKAALRAAVSEALERQIWKHERDYFRGKTIASFQELGDRQAIYPLRFAGYTELQRSNKAAFSLADTTKLLWIEGYSLTQRRRILIPAQIVSRAHASEVLRTKQEPFIREPITTGLATHPDRTTAILSGALEIIERDAFMIMWLNRLSLPRVPYSDLIEENESLEELLLRCSRYSLHVNFVRLITDAPAYVIMTVVRDPRMLTPISVGTCAHQSASHAAEKSLLEALRARKNARGLLKAQKPITADAQKIRFAERHVYWADPTRAHLADFLAEGKEQALESAVWQDDAPREHLERITRWCDGRRYQLVVVDLGISKKNVLGLRVCFVVIPELQPLYLDEANRCEGGERLSSIPGQFGYTPREPLFTEEPHPFV